jgi:AcrR family transcriptional regulator
MTAEPTPPEVRAGPGRPRHLTADAELRRILDATVEVLRRHQYASSSIRDILTEAGLGTRAFYRHFDSKDDLLWAVYRREAESFARRVEAAAASAVGPLAAVEACVEEYLAVFYRRRWAERATALQFAQVERHDDGHDVDRRHASDVAISPLARAIRAGVDSGDLTSEDPDLDARMIRDLAFSLARSGSRRPQRMADAQRHCLRYIYGALGVRPLGTR